MKNFSAILIFLSIVCHMSPVTAQEIKRPNIIFILADDLGWSSLSCSMDAKNPQAKSDFHMTPNLEKLASQGMRFSRNYAGASICCPSRRSILYGATPARLGDESFADRYHPSKTALVPLPKALKAIDQRYKAAHFGKWDMRAGFTPEDAGYDESDGDTGNRDGDVMKDKGDKWTKHFIVDDPKKAFSLTERAIGFMERSARAGAPFYLQISHYATHVDLQARRSTYDQYVSKRPGQMHDNPAFAAMLDDLDSSIGLILEKLESLGLSDNTYVFFTADNGATEFFPPVSNRLDHPDTFAKPMRNSPLRGGKWTLYEGGIRVPMIVRGPGIPANTYSDVPVTGWDLLPTFAELAGGGTMTNGRDGGSFAGVLKRGGKGVVRRPTEALIFHRYNNGYPHSALIDGDLKLVRFWKTGKVELYDLRNDPGERKDIAASRKQTAERLSERLVKYLNEVNPELISSY